LTYYISTFSVNNSPHLVSAIILLILLANFLPGRHIRGKLTATIEKRVIVKSSVSGCAGGYVTNTIGWTISVRGTLHNTCTAILLTI
jgi:hypothetical protein